MFENEFEWDEAKNEANLKKHKVGFRAAIGVFYDAFAVEVEDRSGTYGEERCVITGMAAGVLLSVVYTERHPRIRIISARKATKHEQKRYYDNQTP
jgi:hypothetical protein